MILLADVKWIKIVTDIFDDEKILFIEQLPEADSIIVIWFKLLTLAGKINNGGVMLFRDNIPYTDEMLATIFRRPINTVRLALKTFEEFGMVEIINNAITIPNWSKHQSLDQLEERKEYMREYMREYRKKQKQLAEGKANSKVNSKTNSKTNVNSLEGEEEVEGDIDIEEDTTTEIPTPYETIKDLYNSICKDLSKVRSISSSRKRHLKARWKQFECNLDTFEECFKKVQASVFCTGKNERGWKADFDWLIKNDNNMVKVLEGKYDNKNGGKSIGGNFKQDDDIYAGIGFSHEELQEL